MNLRIWSVLLGIMCCATVPLVAGCSSSEPAALDESDSGSSVTLMIGGEVDVWLGGLGSDHWGEPTIESASDAVHFLDHDTCRSSSSQDPGGFHECLYRFQAAAVGTAQITVIDETVPSHPPFTLGVSVTE